MGYTTEFIGHIEIAPALNTAEQQYLSAFGHSRRCQVAPSPYDIPGNPAAAFERTSGEIDAYNSIATGQPSLWCGWHPCFEGCCLSFDGIEKFYNATRWMEYLIQHFLAPGAIAQRSGASWFGEFAFDHVLNGVIAACRRDTRRLYLIRVDNNIVSEETLWAPAIDYDEFPLLAYEKVKDDSRRRRRRRSSKQSAADLGVDGDIY
jgi:hypothetical protein